MEITSLSDTYKVRRLDAEDVELVYDLGVKNKTFYRYHPPFLTEESILEDMKALPPGKDCSDKFYMGFFEEDTLVAIMDLILDYPAKGTGYIGLFMMNLDYQNRGIGSKIIRECLAHLKIAGFKKVRLGVDEGNPQSNAFWKKNGFSAIGKNEYILMESDL